MEEIEKQLFYACLDCHRIAAGHPTKDPRESCEECGSQNLWEAKLTREVFPE